MTDYKAVIGLEIHAELDTETKVFCSCKNEFGASPNTLVCPVCLGLPGALPVVNKKAVEYTILAGLTFGCTISPLAVFERKNYFYPDLSKAYQITQFQKPICLHGSITLDSGKVISLNRIHLEEDAGKLIHSTENDKTFIDFNRCGVPLIEIVTNPDFNTPEEVVEFLEKLKEALIFSGVSKCRMERGGLRVDVNVSIEKPGDNSLGTRVEMKNLNSFKSVYRAIVYEISRQIKKLSKNEPILQQTRGWDDVKNRNFAMRDKENISDYRYFPDPDLQAIEITREDVEKIRHSMPESALEKRIRLGSLGLTDYDINVILSEKSISDYFDRVNSIVNAPKECANWILTDVLKYCSGETEIFDVLPPENLAKIINFVLSGKISKSNGKTLLIECITTTADPETLINKLNLVGSVDDGTILKIIDDIIFKNPSLPSDFKKDGEKVINFFVGNILKETGGKADVEKSKALVLARINKE